ncbi:MAG: acyltransferase, partial [Asticcacaulis sp.]|nr:acyltransferase [Asticcacaulis sp.]
APIVPIHLEGPNSFWFHTFHKVSQELRDITLFHELLNKQGKLFRLTIGAPVDPNGFDIDTGDLCEALKRHVEGELATDPDKRFVG